MNSKVISILKRDATVACIDRQWDDDAVERAIESGEAIGAVLNLAMAARQLHDAYIKDHGNYPPEGSRMHKAMAATYFALARLEAE